MILIFFSIALEICDLELDGQPARMYTKSGPSPLSPSHLRVSHQAERRCCASDFQSQQYFFLVIELMMGSVY